MDYTATYEYVISAKKKPAYRLGRALMILAYILFVFALFALAFLTGWSVYLLALTPLGLWILVWLTWRYVSVEYEYSMTSGVMTLSRIYGGRTRRVLGDVVIRDAVAIAPFDGEYMAKAERYRPERTVDLTADLQRPNVYYMLYETSDHRRGILYFEATAHALKVLCYYNRETVLRELSE